MAEHIQRYCAVPAGKNATQFTLCKKQGVSLPRKWNILPSEQNQRIDDTMHQVKRTKNVNAVNMQWESFGANTPQNTTSILQFAKVRDEVTKADAAIVPSNTRSAWSSAPDDWCRPF